MLVVSAAGQYGAGERHTVMYMYTVYPGTSYSNIEEVNYSSITRLSVIVFGAYNSAGE